MTRRIEDLTEKVRFLSNSQAYASAPRRVEARETHMSWIFLAGDRVYKLKKPVRRPHLDFSTISKRKFFCEEELRLNRRLAAQTYLRVVPLLRLPSGTLTLGGGGRVCDWLVEMKRLPEAAMLDALILRGKAALRDVGTVAGLLADFYARCEPVRVGGRAYLHHLVEEHSINRFILLRPRISLAGIAAGPLDAVGLLLARLRPEILARIAAGAIVEGHGDLRPEHVCLSHPPQIIDCLEFNWAMRIIDPYDEINYLGMECDMLGAPWIRPVLNAALQRRFLQRPSQDLLALFAAFRALLRARLCMAHLLEKPARHPEKWRPLAIRYIEQAERELLSARPPGDQKSSRHYEDT